jgi:glycosyltransferase involved in cell wall biosynthesis
MLVSIYMPTKNRLASLQLAINSVLNQSYKDIELLVVDDGSTDGSREYLLQLQKDEPRVKIFLNDKSRGACYSRNVAIKAANGDFITGLDDDDEFLPSHIEALVDYWHFLTKYSDEPVSAIYTNFLSRQPQGVYKIRKRNRVTFSDLYSANQVGNQMFAPTSHFRIAGLFDEEMPAWQDLEFFFRILKKFGDARLMDLHTYVFDEMPRDDRISSGKKQRIMQAYKLMSMKHAENSVDSQRLYIQMFSSHYNFPINLIDLINFMKIGFWFSGYKQMIGRYIRRNFLK